VNDAVARRGRGADLSGCLVPFGHHEVSVSASLGSSPHGGERRGGLRSSSPVGSSGLFRLHGVPALPVDDTVTRVASPGELAEPDYPAERGHCHTVGNQWGRARSRIWLAVDCGRGGGASDERDGQRRSGGPLSTGRPQRCAHSSAATRSRIPATVASERCAGCGRRAWRSAHRSACAPPQDPVPAAAAAPAARARTSAARCGVELPERRLVSRLGAGGGRVGCPAPIRAAGAAC
jgi:hypothetical protein